MLPLNRTPSRPATTLLCAGRVHVERGLPAPLDPHAKGRLARVGLMEDGATFCGSCAFELGRGAAPA